MDHGLSHVTFVFHEFPLLFLPRPQIDICWWLPSEWLEGDTPIKIVEEVKVKEKGRVKTGKRTKGSDKIQGSEYYMFNSMIDLRTGKWQR